MLADQEAAQINSPHTREPATAQIKPSNNKHSSTEECETLPEESTASQSSSPTSSSESPNPGPASPGKRKLPALMEISVRNPSTSGFQQQPDLFPGRQGADLSLEHQQASINHGLHHLSSHSPCHHLEASPPLATCLNSHLPSILQPAASGTSLLPSSTPIPSTYRPVLPCIHTSHTFHDGRCSFQLNLPGGEILLLLPQMS